MVLIFLSGAPLNTQNKLYVNNILNTLFLPRGSRNRYRFACAGDHVNVDPDFIPRLERLAGRWWETEQILLIFVDRYGVDGYQFRPLRSGRLVNAAIDGDRLFCEVELDEYVAMNANFAQWIQQNAHGKNYPQLVDNDPNNHNDGYYVIHTSAKWTTLPIVATDDQAWIQHVDALAPSRRFRNPADHQFFFFRADIPQRRGGGRAFKARKGRFKIPRNSRFELRLTYRWPYGAANIPNTRFKVNHSESLRADVNEVQIASPFDTKVINYKAARIPEEDEMKIELVAEPDQNLFRPDAPILFAIGFSKRQIACGIIGPIAFAMGSVLTASDHFSFGIKFLGEILKLFGLGFLFIAFGRKVT